MGLAGTALFCLFLAFASPQSKLPGYSGFGILNQTGIVRTDFMGGLINRQRPTFNPDNLIVVGPIDQNDQKKKLVTLTPLYHTHNTGRPRKLINVAGKDSVFSGCLRREVQSIAEFLQMQARVNYRGNGDYLLLEGKSESRRFSSVLDPIAPRKSGLQIKSSSERVRWTSGKTTEVAFDNPVEGNPRPLVALRNIVCLNSLRSGIGSSNVRFPGEEESHPQSDKASQGEPQLPPSQINQFRRSLSHLPLLAQVGLVLVYGGVAYGLIAYGAGFKPAKVWIVAGGFVLLALLCVMVAAP